MVATSRRGPAPCVAPRVLLHALGLLGLLLGEPFVLIVGSFQFGDGAALGRVLPLLLGQSAVDLVQGSRFGVVSRPDRVERVLQVGQSGFLLLKALGVSIGTVSQAV